MAEGIQQLKSEEGKPIVAFGGAEFMQSLIATGLIDEYQLVTHPVILGEGLPIFNGAKPMDLKLGGIASHSTISNVSSALSPPGAPTH